MCSRYYGPGRMVASTEDSDKWDRHHSIGITGEITSNPTWQLETSYHWSPFRYIGIGASVGIWKEIGGDKIPATNGWRASEDSKSVMNGFFMPSLLLRTPAFIKTEDINIGFMAESGVMTNVPYDRVYIEKTNEIGISVADTKISYNKGTWFAFNFRAGVYASFDNVNISLGYVCSDLDIYAMRRNMQYGNVMFKDFLSQTQIQWWYVYKNLITIMTRSPAFCGAKDNQMGVYKN